MSTETPTSETTTSSQPRAAIVIGLVPFALAAVVALVLLAFGLPAVKAAPHDLAIGVAGPAQATSQASAALEAQQPGAFDVQTFPDEATLSEAIREREIYGGIVVTPTGPTVLTASAASPAAAQALTAIGTGVAKQTNTQPTVRDLVPLTPDDPRGAGLNASLFPLVIGAIAPTLALANLAGRRGVQLAAGTVYSVAAGFVIAAVVHYVFGSIDGNYLTESGVFAATIGASLLVLLGLHRLLGMAGFGIGAGALMLLGNPLSGAASGPAFLASPWREIGQAMPPGAGSQILRSVSFFDGAGASTSWIVLAAWAAAGLALLALPRRRTGGAHEADGVAEAPREREMVTVG